MSMTIYFHSLCIVYSNHVQSWLSRYNNVRLGLFITQLTGILIDHTHNAVNVASLIHSHQSFADGFRIKSRPIANRNRQVKNNGNNIFIDLTIIDPVSNATIDLAVLSIDFIDDDFTIRLDLADFRSTWSTCGHVDHSFLLVLAHWQLTRKILSPSIRPSQFQVEGLPFLFSFDPLILTQSLWTRKRLWHIRGRAESAFSRATQ